MRFMPLFAVLCTSVVLTGCASHAKDYLKNDKEVNSIVVPPGVPMIKQSPYYPVPNIPQNTTGKPVTLLPPTMIKSSVDETK
jgi:hypothetical protein